MKETIIVKIPIASLSSKYQNEDLYVSMFREEDEKFAYSYAKLSSEDAPPITLTKESIIVDGRHRVRAAIIRGDIFIYAYKQVSNQ